MSLKQRNIINSRRIYNRDEITKSLVLNIKDSIKDDKK